MLILLLMLVAIADAKYLIPVNFNAIGNTSILHVTPTIRLRVGSGPGKIIDFSNISTNTDTRSVLTASSCEYSSYCAIGNDDVFTDFAYASDTQFQLSYTINSTATVNSLALFPGSDIWSAGKSLTLCPYERGLLVGYDTDQRCYSDMAVHRHLVVCNNLNASEFNYNPKNGTLINCTFDVKYNDQVVNALLRLDDAHIRVSPDLSICTSCDVIIHDLVIHVGTGTTVKMNELTRRLMYIDDTLPANTITLGLATNEYAFSLSNSKLYINTAWDASGTLSIVDFIVCAIALYALRIWLSWFDLSDEDTGKSIYRGMLMIEFLMSTIGIVVICLHVFYYDFGDRIYRVTDHLTYNMSQVLAYILAAIATIVHYPLHLLTLYDAWMLKVSHCATRKYCFELNMLLTISVIIVKTRTVSFLNVAAAAVGVAMLYKRDIGAYSTMFPSGTLSAFVPICIFVVGVLFAPIFQSISGFIDNTLLGSIYASIIVIMMPSMTK